MKSLFRSQRGIAHLGIIAAIVVLLGVGGAFYLVKSRQDDKKTKASTAETPKDQKAPVSPAKLDPEVVMKEAMVEFQKASISNVRKIERHDGSVWLINKDGYSVVTSASIVRVRISATDLVDFKTVVGFPQMQTLRDAVEKIATNKKLTKDAASSSSGVTDDSLYDYVQAYQGSGIRCTGTVNPDLYSDIEGEPTTYSYEFGCISDQAYEKNNAIQPLLIQAENKNTPLSVIDKKNTAVEVSKEKDGYISAGLHARRTGAYGIFKKVGSGYEFLFGGQAAPSCDQADNKGIPKEIFESCYDEKLGDNRTIKN